MIIKRVMEILSLPITAVIGRLPVPYNDYTCFLPFKKGMDYEYLLVTELSDFALRRIELIVPCSPEEEEICKCIMCGKKVFGFGIKNSKDIIKIPDTNTKYISNEFLTLYPFGTVYVPESAIITPLENEHNIIIRKADFSCKSERYAEVFGQPKRAKD